MSLAASVVERARGAGAAVAEASVSEGRHLSAKVRLGEPELLEEAGSKSVGLRVMRGQQVAVTSTSDLSKSGIERLVQDAIELADLAQPDPFAGPPDPTLLSKPAEHRDLDLFDASVDSIDGARALDMAKRAEKAALGSDKRLNNSEGASVSRQSGASALCTSGGFCAALRGTYVSIVVESGRRRRRRQEAQRLSLERPPPFWTNSTVRRPWARKPRAAPWRKLGSRKIDTQEVAVVFEPERGALDHRSARGLHHRRRDLAQVELPDRARGHTTIASDLVTIVDDPLILRAPGSRPFDGEGLLSRTQPDRRARRAASYSCSTATARASSASRAARAHRAAAVAASAPPPATSSSNPARRPPSSSYRAPSARSTSPT